MWMKDSVSISNLIAQCPAPGLSNISVKILRYDARPPSVIFSQCGEGGHSSNRAAIIEGKSAHIVALPRKTLVMGAGAWSPSQLCWIKATMTKKVFYSSYLVSFYSCAWSFRSFQVFAYHIKHMYADFVRNSSMAKASLNSKEHSEELLLKWLKSRERGNGGCGS